jgi:recombination protein RecA
MADDLTALMRAIKKELGGSVSVGRLTDVEVPYDTRLPTGILSLDVALKGGFPAGSLIQIFGPEAAGKDYLTNLVIADLQRRLGDAANVAYATFGYVPDASLMRMAGVDMGLGNLMYVELGEKFASASMNDLRKGKVDGPAESILDSMLWLLASGQFQLMVVNELLSGETKHNLVKKLNEDPKVAAWATLMANFCQKYYSVMRKPLEAGGVNRTCVLMINPVRANLNANTSKYVKYSQGGGHALKHAKAVDLHLESGGAIREGTDKVGKVVRWKIAKGKHGLGEGANGSFNFLFDKGVDLVADLANVAKAYDVVRNAGPIYYILDLPDKVKGGLEGVTEVLRRDPGLAEKVRQAVLDKTHGGAN